MADDTVVYRFAADGRFRRGVPRRDLTADDVARMDPAVLKDVTAEPPGGGKPMYSLVGRPPETDPQKMTRDELDAHARRVGVADPGAFPNKAALLDAIEAAQQPPAPVGATGGPAAETAAEAGSAKE